MLAGLCVAHLARRACVAGALAVLGLVHVPGSAWAQAPNPGPARSSALLPASTVATATPIPDPADVLVLGLVLEGENLSDGLLALRDRGQVMLPLGELARLLSLAVEVDATAATARGFLVREDRPFLLEVRQGRVSVAGVTQAVDPRLARVQGDDLMVARQLIERWWPVDLNIRLDQMVVIVRPREKLPLQARLERERAGRQWASARSPHAREASVLPLVSSDPAWLSPPTLDLTFGADVRTGHPHQGHQDVQTTVTAFMTADLLGLEGAAYLAASPGQGGSHWRLALGRRDPQAQLLGPLRARHVQAGQIQLPGVASLTHGSGPGTGLMVTNRPFNPVSSFDRQTLRGDLPPGWDVTLYYNDALVGFQAAAVDGQYGFEDLPLAIGRNDFVLVFNGPLGQQRIERRSVSLDQGAARAGEVLYDLAHHQADAGGRRATASVDLGLNGRWVLSAGWLTAPERPPGSGVAIEPQDYARAGLRHYGPWAITSAEVVRQGQGSTLVDLGIKTRVGDYTLDAQHLQAGQGFRSEALASGGARVLERTRFRLQGTLATVPGLRWPVAIDAQRDRLASGSSLSSLSGRLSAWVAGMSVTQSLTWRQAAGTPSLAGELQASQRMQDLGLSGRLVFSVRPQQRLESLALLADRVRPGGWRQSIGLTRDIATRATQVTLGAARSLGRFALSFHASASNRRERALGVQLFIALGRDPRTGRWFTDALPLAGAGAVSALAFVDRNLNGRRDEGEEVVPNAGFIIDGLGRLPVRTGDDGTALIPRLPAGRYLDLAIDPGTLEDPQWKPLHAGVRLLPRPGLVQALELPVAATADIDGTVWRLDGGRRRPLAQALVELVDDRGQVVARAHSAGDGFYLLPQVLAGRYLLRVNPGQRVGGAADGATEAAVTRALEVRASDDFISGQDLEVLIPGAVQSRVRDAH